MTDEQLTLNDTWEVVKAYYNDETFAKDAIKSYDKFIENLGNIPIPTIKVEYDAPNSIHSNTMHMIRFTNVHVGKPGTGFFF